MQSIGLHSLKLFNLTNEIGLLHNIHCYSRYNLEEVSDWLCNHKQIVRLTESKIFPFNLELQYMNQFAKLSKTRDANYYMEQIPSNILEKLNEEERDDIKSVIYTAIPNTSPSSIDLRLIIDLIFLRYFIVLIVGKDISKQRNKHSTHDIPNITNTIVSLLLIIAMSLLISSLTLLFLYLIKSALGIDIFKDHITEVLFKQSK